MVAPLTPLCHASSVAPPFHPTPPRPHPHTRFSPARMRRKISTRDGRRAFSLPSQHTHAHTVTHTHTRPRTSILNWWGTNKCDAHPTTMHPLSLTDRRDHLTPCHTAQSGVLILKPALEVTTKNELGSDLTHLKFTLALRQPLGYVRSVGVSSHGWCGWVRACVLDRPAELTRC